LPEATVTRRLSSASSEEVSAPAEQLAGSAAGLEQLLARFKLVA
jgi:methyl-accepting chemotaxis protein